MEAQPEAGCADAAGYEKRMRVHTRWIRALLGIAFVATLLVAIGVGQSATAQRDGQGAFQATAAPVANITTYETPNDRATRPARIGGELVTTLPATGIGPPDPDKRVSHWLFVAGGTLAAAANFVLAKRRFDAARATDIR